eukprot:4929051-Alexandrium_andersonii.AAC.1
MQPRSSSTTHRPPLLLRILAVPEYSAAAATTAGQAKVAVAKLLSGPQPVAGWIIVSGHLRSPGLLAA